MTDIFSPAALAAAISKASETDDVQLPVGKTRAIVTSYDGKSVSAAYVQKLGDHWSLKSAIEWHGGEPQFGVQVHASW